MKIFGIAGWSGSGKTTLILKLIGELRHHGVRVSTIKRTHHRIEIDEATDDSRRLRDAGAAEVLVVGGRRWALMHELRDGAEPTLEGVLPAFADTELLLVEGFKRNPHAKLEVYRPDLGKPLLCRDDPSVVAIASTADGLDFPVPRYALDDAAAIAAFIIDYCGLAASAPVR